MLLELDRPHGEKDRVRVVRAHGWSVRPGNFPNTSRPFDLLEATYTY
jgi:hypothetical protein